MIIKKLFTLSVISILFLGCGSGGSESTAIPSTPSDTNNSATQEYPQASSDAEVLLRSLIIDSSLTQLSKEYGDIIDTPPTLRQRAWGDQSIECTSGGSITYENLDANWTQIRFNIDLVLSQCSFSDELTNGTIRFDVDINKSTKASTYRETYLNSFTYEHASTALNIAAQSSFNLDISGNDTGNFDTNNSYDFSGSYGDLQLSVKVEEWRHHFEVSTSLSSWYPKSGSVYIGEQQRHYRVDEDYDASATPFVIVSTALQSGQAQYKGDVGDLIKFVVNEAGKFDVYYDPDGSDGRLPFIKLSELAQE